MERENGAEVSGTAGVEVFAMQPWRQGTEAVMLGPVSLCLFLGRERKPWQRMGGGFCLCPDTIIGKISGQ